MATKTLKAAGVDELDPKEPVLAESVEAWLARQLKTERKAGEFLRIVNINGPSYRVIWLKNHSTGLSGLNETRQERSAFIHVEFADGKPSAFRRAARQ